MGSCARKAVPTTSKGPTTSAPAADVARATNVDFRYLSAKGKAQIDQEGNKLPTANITLRVRKDSIIWLSVSVAGFEGARAYITRDSVRVLNKLQREYYAGDFAYLSQRLNVPVTFDQVQAILLGNYLLAPAGATPTVTTEGNNQRVQFQQASLLVEQLINLGQQKVQKLNVRDSQSQNNVTVDFNDFRPVAPSNQLFAYNVVLQIQQAQGPASSATITYRNVDVDKERLAFPFSVPSGYARKK
ncbi:DUF4292 domain-containing protein [Hymenobacter cavernae]|uniref:DUF4292 domain-containing protein n=1 Tax=Hymenobacter cavernae TaxID=2044852 RepID=A0ABQ1TQN8_9BACT|nr:DUF4292 domain-containing protein [Hymenobacter cavernae]GGE98879.1 hypothetical protein GCM10011383_07130 [Hymenobacter cavernae]